ncbi:MAG: riboflavin biosynthesis protein RibF [Bacteroidales bacterium]|nr:riboflavin biosynthesis protein RibF [Bacteroidales bacterium]MDD2322176.1 riboflavin biosynthesis protein RibF [Bacteroidales bacterium]MDD3011020.1 riboflavin biosynthesis protein RibF [Bacteroidales bacterium]MDD3960884.1 riboflavin biosynthesis protein RibF [Bacteroidales bacterium]MDY0287069.1 riboflavin biosynthesis protein RibF [Bacteroidales bacterium]
MRVFTSIEEAGRQIINPVVTTGSFDGVHVGHKMILKRINTLAREVNGESVLITFFPHPRKVLYPEYRNLQLIASQEEKIELLRQTGLNNVIIMQFTKAFAQTTSNAFVENYLVQKLGVRKVVIGFNHHFGRNREGDLDHLLALGKKYNFEVEEIPEQDIQNETVSSTKIREAIHEGYIQKANAYLDHYYIVTGNVTNVIMPYFDLGFPTCRVTIEEESKLIPATGTYAVTVNYNWNQFRALAIIKNCQTPENMQCASVALDLLLLDNKALDGRRVTLTFHKRISELPSEADRILLKKTLENAIIDTQELIY